MDMIYMMSPFITTVEWLLKEANCALSKNVYLAARILSTAKKMPGIPAELVSFHCIELYISLVLDTHAVLVSCKK